MKQYLITLFSSLLVLTNVMAQTGSVKGRAINVEGATQEFVNVLLRSATDSSLIKGSVTELDGTFAIDQVSNGDYFITLSLVGFEDSHSDPFTINNNEINLGDQTLSSGVTLDEVTVTTQRAFIEMKADKMVVNVENSSVNAGNSALEVLEKSPGITVDKDNNISLRGKQGVLVLINGKNQYMTGDQLTSLLESMPANNIKSIEIIANPSAKYDAEGNSGVIDIKLKKNENEGYNGSLSAGARHGIKGSYDASLDANYRSGKTNIYGAVSPNKWASTKRLNLNRTIQYNEGATTFNQSSPVNSDGLGINGRIGIDYNLSQRTTIGAMYKLSRGNSTWNVNNTTMITGDNAPQFSELRVTSEQGNDWTQHSANVNLFHGFDNGMTLSVDADYSSYDGDGDNMYHNEYYNNGQQALSPYDLRNNANSDIHIMAAKADLSMPLSSGYNLDFGVKASMVGSDNSTKFEAMENGSWVNQVNRSNQFMYDETIYAAYTNASTTIGKAQVQAGLRLEHTISDGLSVTLDERVKREYTNLFPSLSVSHMIGDKHSLSYNYSRRLTRPDYEALNPFIEYLDDYTFEKGNPFLTPQYSNSFGVNYGLGNKLFVSVDYSHTTDAITEVIEQESAENRTFQTNQNLDNFNNLSVNISAPMVWNDVFTTRLSLSSFYNDFQSAIPSGTLDNGGWGHYLYLANQVSLPSSIMMEINANYQSSLVYGLFNLRPKYGIDLGFSMPVMNGQGNIKIGLDDVFRTRVHEVTIDQDDINLNVRQVRDTRRAKLNFSYRFGNNKVKAARKRRTATEDETSRLSN